jgi:hypothetical protein
MLLHCGSYSPSNALGKPTSGQLQQLQKPAVEKNSIAVASGLQLQVAMVSMLC